MFYTYIFPPITYVPLGVPYISYSVKLVLPVLLFSRNQYVDHTHVREHIIPYKSWAYSCSLCQGQCISFVCG